MHRDIDTFSQSDKPEQKLRRELCTECSVPIYTAYQVRLHEGTCMAVLNPRALDGRMRGAMAVD